MKKKILIGGGVVLLLIIAYIAYLFATTRSHSPAANASYSKDGLDLNVTYCRPYKKGRLIFGEKTAGALQPFGQYWRLGANDATQISFSKNVLFGGKPVAAGKYRMYAVPGKDNFQVSLNSELDKFGYSEPDYSKDVVKVDVAATEIPETEQFTIALAQQSERVDLEMFWDKTKFTVPIVAQP